MSSTSSRVVFPGPDVLPPHLRAGDGRLAVAILPAIALAALLVINPAWFHRFDDGVEIATYFEFLELDYVAR